MAVGPDLPQNVQFEAYILIKTGSHLYSKWKVSGTLVKKHFSNNQISRIRVKV